MAAETPSLEKIIRKIQAEVFPKRIRPIEFFRDFDPLRKSQVTESQFTRCLKVLMPQLGPSEWATLIAAYEQGNGSVDYRSFCDEIETVFVTKSLERMPTLDVMRGGTQVALTQEIQHEDDEMDSILHRLSLLTRTRGIVSKYCYEDADRGDSASLTVRRRAGRVTEAQFRRCFPLQKDFSEYEITRLVQRYKEEDGTINYRRMHEDITDAVDIVKDAPIPTSHYIEPARNETWSKEKYTILERVTAKVIEFRVRLMDYFLDFDPLRKGFCTVGQLDTVFGILGLKFTAAEMAELKSQYLKQDLNQTLFNYSAFAADVNSAFTYSDIHTDPLARIIMPSSEATMPSRRSKVQLTDQEKLDVAELEADIRARVQKRRIMFINAFKDFDRANQGHVTVPQFARVMQTLGLSQGDEAQISLLAKKYCDLNSRVYFNYREFCSVCDPVPEALQEAEHQNTQPYQKPQPSRYFTLQGQVYDEGK